MAPVRRDHILRLRPHDGLALFRVLPIFPRSSGCCSNRFQRRLQRLHVLSGVVVSETPRFCLWHHGFRIFAGWCRPAHHDDTSYPEHWISLDDAHHGFHVSLLAGHCLRDCQVEIATQAAALQIQRIHRRLEGCAHVCHHRGLILLHVGHVLAFQLCTPAGQGRWHIPDADPLPPTDSQRCEVSRLVPAVKSNLTDAGSETDLVANSAFLVVFFRVSSPTKSAAIMS